MLVVFVTFSRTSPVEYIEVVSELTKVFRAECVIILQEEGLSEYCLDYLEIRFTV
jgi:hypothetical protein